MRYKRQNPVDGGYSWVLLAVCYLSYLITVSIMKSFGILYSELQDVYHSNARITSSIGSTCSFVQFMLCPVAINIGERYSFRGTMFAAGITTGLGFVLSSFVTRIEFLFITYSITIGIGCALSFGSTVTVLNYYFMKRRGLANGILVSGSGVGSFIFPYLYTYLFSNYGLNGALIVLGGIALQGCIGATIIRQPFKPNSEKTLSSRNAKNGFVHNITTVFLYSIKFIKSSFKLDWRLFKNPTFVLNTIAFISTAFGWQANFFMLPAHIEQTGYTKKEAAFAMSIVGLSELCGRIMMGLFLDLNILAPKFVYIICMSISGIAQICVPFLSSYEWFCVYAGIVGLFPGSFPALLPLLLVDIFGQQRFSAAFGLVIACSAVFTVFTHPALGWLKDHLNSWNVPWFITGAFMMLSSVLVISHACLVRGHGDHADAEGDIYNNTDANGTNRPSQGSGNKTTEEETAMLD